MSYPNGITIYELGAPGNIPYDAKVPIAKSLAPTDTYGPTIAELIQVFGLKDYVSSLQYIVGQCVVYDDGNGHAIYRCKQDTTGTFEPDNWDLIATATPTSNLDGLNLPAITGALAVFKDKNANKLRFRQIVAASPLGIEVRTGTGGKEYLYISIDASVINSPERKVPISVTSNGQTVFILPEAVSDKTVPKLCVNGKEEVLDDGFTISGTTLTWTGAYILETTDELFLFYSI